MVYASDLKCNDKHGVTDTGHSLFGTLLSGASLLSAGYNAVRAVQIATDEWNMAKKYWQIAENWLNYYQNQFAPVEDQELHEANDLQLAIPYYDAARARARAVAWLEFRNVVKHATRCTSRYCTGLRADMIANLSAAQADAVAMADGLGYRNERAYVESRNDVRFDKRFNTVKRGRDIVADNVSLAKATAGIYGDLFNQAWDGLTGAGQYLGYYTNRNNTAYPSSYLQGRATTYSRAMGQTAEIAGPREIAGPPIPRNLQE